MSPRDRLPGRDAGEEKPRSKRSQRTQKKPRKSSWRGPDDDSGGRRRRSSRPDPRGEEWDDDLDFEGGDLDELDQDDDLIDDVDDDRDDDLDDDS
jgi:hypothetical protein